MDKMHTVKKNTEFSRIIHTGRYYKNDSYVIYIKDNKLNTYRFGISISKKLGNAVHRNKYKRQLRFIIDKYKKNYQNNFDYIIIIKDGFISSNFQNKESSYTSLIEKINNDMLRRNNEKQE